MQFGWAVQEAHHFFTLNASDPNPDKGWGPGTLEAPFFH
jgi:hypothetical protein